MKIDERTNIIPMIEKGLLFLISLIRFEKVTSLCSFYFGLIFIFFGQNIA